MHAKADLTEFEPFGQRGVRGLARPAFVTLCAIGVAICMAMLVRSQSYYDVLWKSENNKRVDVASAIGRLMVTTRTSYRNPQSGVWTYESVEIANMDDGWQPSIWKTIGLDWGTEQFTSFSGRQITQWRLRLKWRTLLILYLTPVLIDALIKWRSRQRTARHGFEVATDAARA